MIRPSTRLVVALGVACVAPADAQSFAAQLTGTWQGTYCGGSATTFRIDTRTPQRSWATERWCNGWACGDMDYSITGLDAASRVVTVHAVQGTGFSTAGYDIRFQLSGDGRSMRGTYVGHSRCNDSQLTKISSDPGSGPFFAGSVSPLPSPSAVAAVRASRLPEDVPRAPMRDASGSTECLVSARHMSYKQLLDANGNVVYGDPDRETQWIYNRCSRNVGYTKVLREDGDPVPQSIAPGDTHIWACEYMRSTNLIGIEYVALAFCRR